MSAPLDTDEQVLAELDAIAASYPLDVGTPDFWQRTIDLCEREARCWRRAAELAVARGSTGLEFRAMVTAEAGAKQRASRARVDLRQREIWERERVQ